MSASKTVLLALVVLAVACAQPVAADPPPTVATLNVTAYLGRWYQVYQDFLTSITFQNNSFCATATYGFNESDPSKLTVYNWERQYNVTGFIRSIRGYAYQTHPQSAPGKLEVVLYGAPLGLPAPYWIVETGPIIANQYQYAIVSDELKATLFVLTRDVKTFKRIYEKRVLDRLQELGYTTFFNKPIPLQQDGCTYPEGDKLW